MTIKPLFARVVLKREAVKSSLIIPEDARRRNAPAKGIVVSTGPTCDDSVKELIGKTVIFGQHAGAWFNEDGTPAHRGDDGEFYVTMDEDLIAEVT